MDCFRSCGEDAVRFHLDTNKLSILHPDVLHKLINGHDRGP